MTDKKKVLLVSPELAELAAVGGIAEYTLGLAMALLRRGHDVRVAIPSYGYLRPRSDRRVLEERLIVKLGVGASEVAAVSEIICTCPGSDDLHLPVFLVGEHRHFATVRNPADIYRWPTHEPWIAFCRAIVDFLASTDWRPDLIHCQDAHAALVPVYVRYLRETEPSAFASSTRTILTIHNLLNQGRGEPDLVAYAALPRRLFDEWFEFYGEANCFKAGLL